MNIISHLSPSQKFLVGGIFGTCIGVFFLNSASADLQRRRMKAGNGADGVNSGYYKIKDGRFIKPKSLLKSDSALGSFLDNTWTIKFIRENLMTSTINIQEGRYYTLLTSGFNHSNLVHLGMNMGGFLGSAPLLMITSGTPAFIGVWILSGLAGSTVAMAQTRLRIKECLQGTYPNKLEIERLENTGAVGASASLFGLFATLAIMYPQSQWQFIFIPYGIRAPILLGAALTFSVIADAANLLPYIGHSAHAGGMVAGAMMGLVLKSRLPVRRILR